jgi:hypothetical protein
VSSGLDGDYGAGVSPPAYPISARDLRPGRSWYAVAAGLVVLTAVAVGSFAWRAFETVPSPPTVLQPGANQLRLEREGLTVFSSEARASASCQATTPGGQEVRFTDPTASEQISIGDGRNWYVALRSAEPGPAGTYTVTCAPVPPGVFLAAGPRASVLTFVGAVLGALVAGALGLALAAAVAVVVLLKRRGHRRRLLSRPVDTPPHA